MSSSLFSLTAQLLAAFNQTIAHGLLRSIQKTNAKLEQLEESLISSSDNPSGKQAKSFFPGLSFSFYPHILCSFQLGACGWGRSVRLFS